MTDSEIPSNRSPCVTEETPMIHVVGVGLSGANSLSSSVLARVEAATLIVGAQRHLDAVGSFLKEKHVDQAGDADDDFVETWPLGNFTQVFDALRSRLKSHPKTRVVILASGDPLFFGLGRLLLSAFPADQLVFHPQVSSIQLAFSRLKLPWQDATLLSVHGRDGQQLVKSLKRGDRKIAVLTDGVLTPGAIAKLIIALDLPVRYQLWVCENLGHDDEHLQTFQVDELAHTDPSRSFAALNVVVLCRQESAIEPIAAEGELVSQQPSQQARSLPSLPLIGLPDAVFKSFPDRPTLMTKREIRLLILGALAPLPGQTIWDIGAGTGSVSIELSRLCPTARLYAIEKTAMGAALIRHNADRLAIAPIKVIQGNAPIACVDLPTPSRVFIGGSSGQLQAILDFCNEQVYFNQNAIASDCRIVLALATLEHLSQVMTWLQRPTIADRWQYQLTQINISKSLPVGPLTRFQPLNPITLITLSSGDASCF